MKKKRALYVINIYYIKHLWDDGTFQKTYAIRYKNDLIDLFRKYNYPYNFSQLRDIFAKQYAVIDIYVGSKDESNL